MISSKLLRFVEISGEQSYAHSQPLLGEHVQKFVDVGPFAPDNSIDSPSPRSQGFSSPNMSLSKVVLAGSGMESARLSKAARVANLNTECGIVRPESTNSARYPQMAKEY